MSWTLDIQWSWLLCALANFEQMKTGNQQPPDWLKQKVACLLEKYFHEKRQQFTVILQNILKKSLVNFNQNKK